MSMVSTMKLWLVYTHMSAAMFMALVAMASASIPGTSARARAAAEAKAPPEPTPMIPSLGSSTSPLPVSSKLTFLSHTRSTASRRRRYLSVRHALAKSTQARVNCPGCSSSLSSRRSRSVKASAVLPAKPTSTSFPIRRTFFAFGFTVIEPWLTWPSPISTTLLTFLTQRMVVARGAEEWKPAARGRAPYRRRSCLENICLQFFL
mmetsp:Transcript_67837/g.153514  ORF Transcript_67837/g.153514 Transcript_67837/m.153514 type:complete len:205 (-) Transcript_67837:34-648(-)